MEGRVEIHEETVADDWEWEITPTLPWGSIPTITRKAEVMASTVTFLEDMPVNHIHRYHTIFLDHHLVGLDTMIKRIWVHDGSLL